MIEVCGTDMTTAFLSAGKPPLSFHPNIFNISRAICFITILFSEIPSKLVFFEER